MKKILTLVLALAMVLALAAPAMAFTSDSTGSSSITPTLSLYLVDYSDNGFFGVATLPTADRGYATNEIVAAVAELSVPVGATTAAYNTLTFGGTNVSLNVTDNASGVLRSVSAGTLGTTSFTLSTTSNTLTFNPTTLVPTALTSAVTYKYLFFAKVTADNATLTANLTDGAGVGSTFDSTTSQTSLVLNGVTYTVTKNYNSSSGGYYDILVGTYTGYTGDNIRLYVNASYQTTGMAISTSSYSNVPLGVTVGGVLGYLNGSTVVTSTSDAEYIALMDVYNTIAKGVFGLDYFKIGNYLYDSFFTGFTSPSTLTATVAIKPWTAYVTVPDTVVVTPPKTGDAAGIMGFVMIALAAAAAVVVRKVRA